MVMIRAVLMGCCGRTLLLVGVQGCHGLLVAGGVSATTDHQSHSH